MDKVFTMYRNYSQTIDIYAKHTIIKPTSMQHATVRLIPRKHKKGCFLRPEKLVLALKQLKSAIYVADC